MSQNLQLQKVTNSYLQRIRHRRRLVLTNTRVASRQPGQSNFLAREATRANTVGGVAGVTGQEILTALEGQLDDGGTVPTITRARHIRQATVSADYTAQGVPIV